MGVNCWVVAGHVAVVTFSDDSGTSILKQKPQINADERDRNFQPIHDVPILFPYYICKICVYLRSSAVVL